MLERGADGAMSKDEKAAMQRLRTVESFIGDEYHPCDDMIEALEATDLSRFADLLIRHGVHACFDHHATALSPIQFAYQHYYIDALALITGHIQTSAQQQMAAAQVERIQPVNPFTSFLDTLFIICDPALEHFPEQAQIRLQAAKQALPPHIRQAISHAEPCALVHLQAHTRALAADYANRLELFETKINTNSLHFLKNGIAEFEAAMQTRDVGIETAHYSKALTLFRHPLLRNNSDALYYRARTLAALVRKCAIYKHYKDAFQELASALKHTKKQNMRNTLLCARADCYSLEYRNCTEAMEDYLAVKPTTRAEARMVETEIEKLLKNLPRDVIDRAVLKKLMASLRDRTEEGQCMLVLYSSLHDHPLHPFYRDRLEEFRRLFETFPVHLRDAFHERIGRAHPFPFIFSHPEPYRLRRADAYTHLNEGRHEEALHDFSLAINYNPHDAENFYQRGITHWHLAARHARDFFRGTHDRHVRDALRDIHYAINRDPQVLYYFSLQQLLAQYGSTVENTGVFVIEKDEFLEHYRTVLTGDVAPPDNLSKTKLLEMILYFSGEEQLTLLKRAGFAAPGNLLHRRFADGSEPEFSMATIHEHLARLVATTGEEDEDVVVIEIDRPRRRPAATATPAATAAPAAAPAPAAAHVLAQEEAPGAAPADTAAPADATASKEDSLDFVRTCMQTGDQFVHEGELDTARARYEAAAEACRAVHDGSDASETGRLLAAIHSALSSLEMRPTL